MELSTFIELDPKEKSSCSVENLDIKGRKGLCLRCYSLNKLEDQRVNDNKHL